MSIDVILDKSADHLRAALSNLDNFLYYTEDVHIEIARLAFNIQLILSDIQSLKGKYDGKS